MSFGNQGSVKYQLVIDDSNVNIKLNSFKNGLQQLNFATQNTTRGVTNLDNADIRFNRNIQAVQQQIDRTKQSLNQFAQMLTPVGRSVTNMGSSFTATLNPIQNSGNALNQFGSTAQKSGESFKKWGGFLKNNIANVGLLAGGIAGLDDQFLGLHKAQVANERANLMVDKSQQKVNRTQEALNKMVAAGKTGTADYTLKQRDLELATEQLDIAQQRATVAQENLSERSEDFWTGIIPNALFIGGSAGQMISSLGINMNSLKGFTSKLSNVVPALAQGFIGLGGGATTASVGLSAVAKSAAIASLYLLPVLIALESAPNLIKQGQNLINSFNNKEAASSLQSIKDNLLELIKAPTLMDPNTWSHVFMPPERVKQINDDINTLSDAISRLNRGEALSPQLAEKVNNITAGMRALGVDIKLPIQQIGKLNDIATISTRTFKATSAEVEILSGLMDPHLTESGGNAAEALNNVSNEMLGILPYTERMNEEFKKWSAEAEMLSTEFETGVLASTLAIKEMAMGFDLLKNTTEPVNDEMESMLSTLEQSAPVWDKQIEAAQTSSLIMGEVDDMLGDLSFKQDDWSRKIDSSNKAIEEQNKLMEEWEKFATDFNTNDLGLAKIFKFDEKFDSDKIAKNLIKGLPSKLEKKMKLDLKFETRDAATEEGIQKFLQRVLDAKPAGGFTWDPDLKINDKGATEIAKDLIKSIDKNTTDADLAAFRKKLKEAVDRGASESEINQILADHVADAPPIPVYVVAAPGSAQDVQNSVGTVNIPAKLKFENIKNTKSSHGGDSLEIESMGIDNAFDITATATIIPDTSKVDEAITQTSEDITNLTQIQPQISLQNKKAIKATDVIAKRIDSLEKIKPQISLQNKQAIKAVDVVAKRINSLSDLHPVVHVQVKYDDVKKFASGGSFTTSGPELIMVGDNPGGRERVSVTPYSSPGVAARTGSSGGDGGNGDTIHIHNHFLSREILQTYQRENGRLRSRMGPS